MADSNNAEERDLLKLSFDITKIKEDLQKVDIETLNLANKIEKYFKNIDFSGIDTGKIEKRLAQVSDITDAQAKRLIAQNISTNLTLEKEMAKRQTITEKVNSAIQKSEQETQDYIKKVNTATNEYIRKTSEKSKSDILKIERDEAAQLARIEAQKNKEIEVAREKHVLDMEKYNQRMANNERDMYEEIGSYAKTYLVYTAFNELKRAAIELSKEMVDVEYRMSEISRAMADGSLNVNAYRDEIIQLAYDYGNTFDVASDIVLRFVRVGLSAADSIAMTEKALLALNTAELDAEEATEDMIAILSQWNALEGTTAEKSEYLESTIDKINKVADSFSVSSQDLLDALKKTSSGFNIAGATIDETIALITAAEVASKRGGKAIGTAMSNMAQQLKTEGRLDILEELGIDVFEDADKTIFLPLTEIFENMAAKMEELENAGKGTSVEMQKLMETFTVFRRNIGTGLLSEMSGEDNTYLQALEVSLNSSGYSAQENAKHMATAKAALAQFSDTLLELKTTIWDSGAEDFFRSLIELAGDLSNGIKWLVDNFGLLPTILGTVTLGLSAFNKNLWNVSENITGSKTNIRDLALKIKELNTLTTITGANEQKFNTIIEGQSEEFKKYAKSVEKGKISLTGYGAALVAARAQTVILTAKTIALQAAMSMGLSLAITAVVELIMKLVNYQDELISKYEEAITKIDDEKRAYDDEISTLEELISQYQELAEQERTPEVNQELYNIQKQLVDLLGDEAEGIDLINLGYEEQLKLLQKITLERQREQNQKQYESLALEKDLAEQNKIQISQGSGIVRPEGVAELVKTGVTGYKFSKTGDFIEEFNAKSAQDQLNTLKQYQTELQGMDQENKNVSKSLEWVNGKIATLEGSLKNLNDKTKEFNENLLNIQGQEIVSQIGETGVLDTVEGYKYLLDGISQIEDKGLFEGSLDEYREGLRDVVMNLLPEMQAEYIEIQEQDFAKDFEENIDGIKDSVIGALEALSDLNASQIAMLEVEGIGTEEQVEQYNKLKEVAEEYDISVIDLINTLIELGAVQEENSSLTQESVTELSEAVANLEEVSNKYSILNTAVSEFNSVTGISISTLKSLVDNNLLQYLDVVNGKLVLNKDAMLNLANVTRLEAEEALRDNAVKEIQSIISEDLANKQATLIDRGSKVANAFATIGRAAANNTDELLTFGNALQYATNQGVSEEALGNIQNVINRTNAMIDSLKNIDLGGTISYSGVSSGGGGRSSSTSNYVKEAEKVEDDRFKIFKEGLEERERLEKRWVDKQKDLGQLSLEDEKYITRKRIERYQQYIDTIKKLDYGTEEEKLELQKQYYEDIEDLQVEYIKLQEEILNEEIDRIKEKNEEKIQSIEDAADKEIEALEEVEDTRDRIREKEEYEAKRQELMHGYQGIEYWSQRTGREAQLALEEAKKELDDLDKEWQEKVEDWNTEDQIAAIEEKRDAEIAAIEKVQEAEIAELQAVYDAKVKMFAETGQLIYDESVMQSQALYNSYKENFIDPLAKDLQSALTPKKTETTPSYSNYTIQYGDTLSGIAYRFGTTVSALMEANPYITNKNLIYAGKNLRIPKYHDGGLTGGYGEFQAKLIPNELVLNPEWTKKLKRIIDKTSVTQNTFNNGTSINVEGNLVELNAEIKDHADAQYTVKLIEKTLKDKFNIKK